jgi:hypothetical protein
VHLSTKKNKREGAWILYYLCSFSSVVVAAKYLLYPDKPGYCLSGLPDIGAVRLDLLSID